MGVEGGRTPRTQVKDVIWLADSASRGQAKRAAVAPFFLPVAQAASPHLAISGPPVETGGLLRYPSEFLSFITVTIL